MLSIITLLMLSTGMQLKKKGKTVKEMFLTDVTENNEPQTV